MLWHQPVMEEGSKPIKFSLWIYASISILSFFLYFWVMFFLHYDENFSSLLITFLNLILAPVIMAISCSLFAYNYYLSQIINYQYRIEFIKSKKQLWRNWAQQSLTVIGYSYVSPKENNALKIVGLDGNAESNAGQNLKIDRFDNQKISKLNFILDELLNPLIKELQKNSNKIQFDIYAPHLELKLGNALAIFNQKNNITILGNQINFLTSEPNLDSFDEWISDEQKLHVLILISVDLEPKNSEFAVALIFRSSDMLESKIGTKIYRPLKTDEQKLNNDFALLVSSNQIKKENISHMWAVNMSQLFLDNIKSNFDENKFNNINRLELFEGNIDKTHLWLAIAYACQVVAHGQKGQLVSLHNDGEIGLLQIEKTERKKEVKENKKINDFPLTYLISIILMFISISFLPHDFYEKKLILFTILCGSFFFALLLCISLPFKKNLLNKKMENEWNLLGKENNEQL
ncbi:hypothetical protein PT276_00470 [Orbaceae bacterium ESL0721]|nr:hypothetical protein [Orbaceae bacterium ESL0721]